MAESRIAPDLSCSLDRNAGYLMQAGQARSNRDSNVSPGGKVQKITRGCFGDRVGGVRPFSLAAFSLPRSSAHRAARRARGTSLSLFSPFYSGAAQPLVSAGARQGERRRWLCGRSSRREQRGSILWRGSISGAMGKYRQYEYSISMVGAAYMHMAWMLSCERPRGAGAPARVGWVKVASSCCIHVQRGLPLVQ